MVTSPLDIAGLADAPRAGIRIRPVGQSDAGELRRFYTALSAESRRRRFLGLRSGLTAAEASHLCAVDHVHTDGFVATAGSDKGERIVGHMCLEPVGREVEEVGVAVADDCQRHGVGRALYAAALSSAESRGIHQLEATLFAYNNPVRLLLTGAGRPYRIESDELGTLYLTIDLAGTQAA
jgi:GNAT superfamily N-acetyltransferase